MLVTIAYFSTLSEGFDALYGGLISLSNTALVNRRINKKHNTAISVQAGVRMMIVSVLMRITMVIGLISIGMFALKLSADAVIVSLVLGVCGFLIDKVLEK